MDIVFFLVPASLFLALIALGAFFWSVLSGQMEDLDTPPRRILFDDEVQNESPPSLKKEGE
ncbi:MAG: cbb3-type cytochrome oxidase assembly protein CcoS [Bdellovibrionales bacterium]|nr:cbb3-type cytochrome oxidase assembly protein CcoS [Bdellovibrionales bacterium]